MPLAVCATPIGNLDDVTLRVLAELREADVVLCEDTRRTRILLDRHGIEARLVSFHRHNEAARTEEALSRLTRGRGSRSSPTPACPASTTREHASSPRAVAAGAPTTVLPGPSAVETALVASGLVGDRYQFVGYLPRREGERAALAHELARWPHAVVAFESPRRLPGSLAALAEVMPARPAAVCRELTKRFEEVVVAPLSVLASRFSEPARGEITVVLGSAPALPEDRESDGPAAVRELVAAGVTRRHASDVVSRLTGTPRNTLYRGSL